MAEEGNGDVGGDAGLPASRELVGTKRKARRFLWKHRRGEGWILAAVELFGALGCSWSIVRERAEGIGTEGEIRESERVRGGRVASPGSSGGKQGGRRWPKQGGGGRGAWPRAPGACPSSWQGRKATGGSGGGLGRPAAVLGRFGYQVSAR